MARWSSGQDGGLSRRKQEFDSPTGHQYSSLAQSVEHAAVNRGVVGSSPTGGAKKRQVERLAVFLLHNLRCSAYYRYGSYDYSNSFAINSSVLIRPSRL